MDSGQTPPHLVPQRSLGIAVFLVAASTLALEVALTRVASALFFTQVTALLLAGCLAALGLGAAFAHRFFARRAPSPTDLLWLASAGALSGVLMLLCVTHAPLLFVAGAFAWPFFCAGAFAAVAYRLSDNPASTFAWEALGGATGAFLAPCLLGWWGDVTAVLLALFLLVPAAFVLPVSPRRAHWLLLPLPLLLSAHVLLPQDPLELDPFATPLILPHLVEQTRAHHGRVLQTRVDSYARTDLVQTDAPWLRYLYTDRMYAARVVRWDGRTPRFPDAEPNQLTRLKRLVFHALQPAKVLVLGAGGGLDVALALQEQAQQVDAVEVNAAMIGFVRQLGEFCGHVLDRPDVRVHPEEARRFLRDARGPWDVVELSLMQTDSAALRSMAGVQNWVMTREATRAYLDHLTPSGTLAIVQNTAEIANRTVWTVNAALAQRGVSAADLPQHLVALALPETEHNPFSQLLLVRPVPFTEAERAALVAEARGIGAQPRNPPNSPDRFNLPTDAHPVFYPAHPLQLALYAGLSLSALAVAWLLLRRHRVLGQPLPAMACAQGVLLGAGLTLAQAALLCEMQFLVGNPPVAVAWTVGGLLASSALGASAAQSLRSPPRRQLQFGALAVVLLLLTLLLLGPTAGVCRALALSTPSATLAFLLLPLGMALGACFPAFLVLAGGDGGRDRAALYAVDGLGAVAGGGIAVLLYALSGIDAVVGAALLCYATLGVLARLLRATDQPSSR